MTWHDTHSAHIYLEKHCVFLLTWWALDACRAHEVFFVAHILHFFVIYVPPAHILVRFLFVANIFGVLDLFPGRILRQSVVYAGSDQRLRLSLEFDQISAGIYQCAIQRRGDGGADQALAKVLKSSLNWTCAVSVKCDHCAWSWDLTQKCTLVGNNRAHDAVIVIILNLNSHRVTDITNYHRKQSEYSKSKAKSKAKKEKQSTGLNIE